MTTFILKTANNNTMYEQSHHAGQHVSALVCELLWSNFSLLLTFQDMTYFVDHLWEILQIIYQLCLNFPQHFCSDFQVHMCFFTCVFVRRLPGAGSAGEGRAQAAWTLHEQLPVQAGPALHDSHRRDVCCFWPHLPWDSSQQAPQIQQVLTHTAYTTLKDLTSGAHSLLSLGAL